MEWMRRLKFFLINNFNKYQSYIYVYILLNIATLFYLLIIPHSYLAFVRIIPRNPDFQGNGLISNLIGITNIKPDNMVNLDFYLKDIINSNIILDEILNKKYLIEGDTLTLYNYLNVTVDTTLADWKLKRIVLARKIFLRNNLYYLENINNSLITIGIISKNGELAKQVLQQLLNSITKYFDKYYLTKLREEKKHVEEKIQLTKERLNKIEKKLIDFYRQNTIVEAKTMAKVMEDHLLRERSIQSGLLLEMEKKNESIDYQIISNQNKLNIIDKIEKPVIPFKPNKKLMAIILNIFYLGILIFIAIFKEHIFGIIKRIIPD